MQDHLCRLCSADTGTLRLTPCQMPSHRPTRGSGDELPVVHRARGRQGLVVFGTPLDVQMWPCRLWRVDGLEDPVRPWPNSYYLRCRSFRVVEEMPPWLVFGPRGTAVAAVVDRASRLSQADAEALAAVPDEEETRAYCAVFAGWRQRRETGDVSDGSLRPAGCGDHRTRDVSEQESDTLSRRWRTVVETGPQAAR
jgi:hypothetical protein